MWNSPFWCYAIQLTPFFNPYFTLHWWQSKAFTKSYFMNFPPFPLIFITEIGSIETDKYKFSWETNQSLQNYFIENWRFNSSLILIRPKNWMNQSMANDLELLVTYYLFIQFLTLHLPTQNNNLFLGWHVSILP